MISTTSIPKSLFTTEAVNKSLSATASMQKSLYSVANTLFTSTALPAGILYFMDNTPVYFLDGGYAWEV